MVWWPLRPPLTPLVLGTDAPVNIVSALADVIVSFLANGKGSTVSAPLSSMTHLRALSLSAVLTEFDLQSLRRLAQLQHLEISERRTSADLLFLPAGCVDTLQTISHLNYHH